MRVQMVVESGFNGDPTMNKVNIITFPEAEGVDPVYLCALPVRDSHLDNFMTITAGVWDTVEEPSAEGAQRMVEESRKLGWFPVTETVQVAPNGAEANG